MKKLTGWATSKMPAELQYTAKKIENFEAKERQHDVQQQQQHSVLQRNEATALEVNAERREVEQHIRSLDEQLHDEQLANKDLGLEVANLRHELQGVKAAQDNALIAADNYPERTLEGQF